MQIGIAVSTALRVLCFYFCFMNGALALPQNFVYLSDVDPSILQDIRYAGHHNFIGRPVQGYQAKTCILTQAAAHALSRIQTQLLSSSLSLKVYDCYRPRQAVAEFMVWSGDHGQQEMKNEFYPHVNKADLFRLGYVAEKSGHSRGSTVDLTIVALPEATQARYAPGQHLVSCTLPYPMRFHDNSLDMGSGYDCMDPISHVNDRTISHLAHSHRQLLRHVMMQNGFAPYRYEWWHFTLQHEPYPHHYFNFAVSGKGRTCMDTAINCGSHRQAAGRRCRLRVSPIKAESGIIYL